MSFKSGLKAINLFESTNIIIVSDHGMSELSLDKIIFVEDYINMTRINFVDWSPVGAVWPIDQSEEEVS